MGRHTILALFLSTLKLSRVPMRLLTGRAFIEGPNLHLTDLGSNINILFKIPRKIKKFENATLLRNDLFSL